MAETLGEVQAKVQSFLQALGEVPPPPPAAPTPVPAPPPKAVCLHPEVRSLVEQFVNELPICIAIPGVSEEACCRREGKDLIVSFLGEIPPCEEAA